MEIRIYNPQMEFLGVIENQRSLLWNRAFNDTGNFELHVPVTDYAISLLQRGNLVWKKGAVDAGVIEARMIEEAYDKREITLGGRFLTSYMDRRLVRPTFNFSGRAEVAMRTMLTNAVAIPLVQLGTLNDFTETIDFQATYKNLLSTEEKVAKASNYGFRFRPDFTNKTITFEIYKGVDKSFAQSDNPRVIFADDYSNLNKATWEENDQVYSNVCYVGGQGEGADRVYVTVGDDTLKGLERREMFANASDITQESLTLAQYKEKLSQRGIDTLEEHTQYQSAECEVLPYGNFEYLTDYDVGDIVSIVKSDWGIRQDLRITGISEIYENGTMTIAPTFGTPLPTKINWEDDL